MIKRLRELLQDYYATVDYTQSLSHARALVRELPALLDRMEKLEARQQAAERLAEAANFLLRVAYIGYRGAEELDEALREYRAAGREDE